MPFPAARHPAPQLTLPDTDPAPQDSPGPPSHWDASQLLSTAWALPAPVASPIPTPEGLALTPPVLPDVPDPGPRSGSCLTRKGLPTWLPGLSYFPQLSTVTSSLGYLRQDSPETLGSNRLREALGGERRGKKNCSIFIKKETKKGSGVSLALNDPGAEPRGPGAQPSTVVWAEPGWSGHRGVDGLLGWARAR